MTDPAVRTGDLFGWSVALAAAGTPGVVGAPDARGGGAAWVFARAGHTCRRHGGNLLTRVLASTRRLGGQLGRSLAISPDDVAIAVGAPAAGGGQGSVGVFVRRGTTWVLACALRNPIAMTPGDDVGAAFGTSLALAASAGTVVVGAAYAHDGRGALVTYARSRSRWARTHIISASGTALFGTVVALEDTARSLIVGAPGAARGNGIAIVYGVRTG
jgi:hypothetical protein